LACAAFQIAQALRKNLYGTILNKIANGPAQHGASLRQVSQPLPLRRGLAAIFSFNEN